MNNRNPKILHVVISMVVGGAERLVYDMVRNPVFVDNPPVVCCMDTVGDLGEKLKQEGYKVYCKGRKPGFDVEMISWLRRIIKNEGIEVVHAHQYSPLAYATPAAFLAGRKKVVYTEHGRFYPDRKSWKRSLINPFMALGVRHLVSISAATAQAMAVYDNLPERRIQVVHNGIAIPDNLTDEILAAKHIELGLDQTNHVIGTAARLNSIKNIPMMLRSFKLVLEKVPDCCLLIAGVGDVEAELRKQADQLEIRDQIKFIGLRFDLPEIYPLFDVFLLTSFSEGISVTLLEAMANGVPAVVTDVGGNGEVVVNGETGFLVPVDDDLLFAEKIVNILANPSLRTSLGEESGKRVKTLFSEDRMLEQYLRLYR